MLLLCDVVERLEKNPKVVCVILLSVMSKKKKRIIDMCMSRGEKKIIANIVVPTTFSCPSLQLPCWQGKGNMHPVSFSLQELLAATVPSATVQSNQILLHLG